MGSEQKLKIVKRSRKEALKLLQKSEKSWREYCSFPQKYQEDLLQFCMGKRGLRITYDTVFKNVFAPDKHQDWLENFISSILAKRVRIVRVLQHQGIRMQEKGSFVIMDVVVELEDGSLLNIEMQKVGYNFPAERTDCYLADLLMRQYNDVKKARGKKFSFRDMSKVVSIVIMEQSPQIFYVNTGAYIHQGRMQYNTGVQLNDLFENFYICLDTYKDFIHTGIKIRNRREAWMLFLSSTELDDIMKVCEYDPQFIPLYQQVFDFGKDVDELVKTFTDALHEMDRNEERLMVEELQEELKLEKMHNEQLKGKMQAELNAAYAEIEKLKRQR